MMAVTVPSSRAFIIMMVVAIITRSYPTHGFVVGGKRLDLLHSLKQQAVSPSTTPQELTTVILDSLITLEKEGSYLTRTELECVLQHCPHPRPTLSPLIDKASSSLSKDITSSYSYQVVKEAMKVVPSQQALNLWRRNVALRQNRVLMPARAAELYCLMINTCLAEGEWELPQQ